MIQDIDVHESFNGEDIVINLLRHTFQKFIQNDSGMVFVIPQKLEDEKIGSVSTSRIVKDKFMIKQYEKCGFSRIFNSEIDDVVMEIEVHKLKNFR